MQAFLRSKHRLRGREEANISQITVNLTFKNSTSSNSNILSHVGLVRSRIEGKVCGSFYEDCKSNFPRATPNAYQSILHLHCVTDKKLRNKVIIKSFSLQP